MIPLTQFYRRSVSVVFLKCLLGIRTKKPKLKPAISERINFQFSLLLFETRPLFILLWWFTATSQKLDALFNTPKTIHQFFFLINFYKVLPSPCKIIYFWFYNILYPEDLSFMPYHYPLSWLTSESAECKAFLTTFPLFCCPCSNMLQIDCLYKRKGSILYPFSCFNFYPKNGLRSKRAEPAPGLRCCHRHGKSY